MTDEELTDRLAIRDVVENWVIARDSADWDLFRRQWHDDGYMMATWFQGPRDDFIRVSQEGFAKGVNILHFTGASQAVLSADRTRAISQTRMTILQRGLVHGVLADVACTGRFYDFFAKRDGRWGIVLRQPIYEKDRLDPVTPGAVIEFDADLLSAYPEGYRYLAYLQVQAGYPVKTDMPGLRGPEVEALYARGAAWLAGADVLLPALLSRCLLAGRLSSVEFGGPPVVGGLGRLDLGEVRVGPGHQLPDRRVQGLAERGERVVDARGHGRVRGPGDDAVALKPAQGYGEHARGDSVDAAQQLAEPARPVAKPVHHVDGPLVTDPAKHTANPARGRRRLCR
jgi:SnoaL-like domain